MKRNKILSAGVAVFVAVVALGAPVWAAAGVQVGASGKTYASSGIQNVPKTQLNGTTRLHTPVYLSAGLNVISASYGSISTDYYVRDGGNGSCTLP